MTLEADKETVRRWITGIWDEGSREVFAELVSADYVYRASGQEDQRGEAVLEFGNAFRSAIPDLNNTIEGEIN